MSKTLSSAIVILALSIGGCASYYTRSYTICNDVNVQNNDCPDNTANVVVENDLKGM